MNLELAKRAVACKRWRWMPGMRAVDGAERFRVSVVSHGYPEGVDEQPPMKVNVDLGLRWLPDLTDPATGGCLLALVRKAWGDCTIWTMVDVDCDEGAWICTGLEVGEIGSGYSEAHALVAALEAAP